MRVSFDLDEVLFVSPETHKTEPPLAFPLRILFKERLRLGTPELLRRMQELGYEVWATRGTSTALWKAGVESNALYRIQLGSPNALDLISRRKVKWIVNIREDEESAAHDSLRIRSAAVAAGVPLTTTLAGFAEAVKGIVETRRERTSPPLSLQESLAAAS